MNRQAIMVCAAVAILGVIGAKKIQERIGELEVRQVSVPSGAAEALSTQEFYPIFARSETSQGKKNTGQLDGAFYTPPPPPPPEPKPVEVAEPEIVVTVEPPPPEPDPVNFLDKYQHFFALQATFDKHDAAIINGISYLQGEYLQGGLPVSHQNRYGEMQQEVLRIRVARVSSNSVTLSAEHSEGWQQHLTLSIST
jgi:hypothetical protein